MIEGRITEIAAVRFCVGKKKDIFRTYVNLEKEISQEITNLTGTTNAMVKDAPGIREALMALKDFCGNAILLLEWYMIIALDQ